MCGWSKYPMALTWGIESRSRGPSGPARRGREHLVDLERSEQIYLVIRDRFFSPAQPTWKVRPSGAAFLFQKFTVVIIYKSCKGDHTDRVWTSQPQGWRIYLTREIKCFSVSRARTECYPISFGELTNKLRSKDLRWGNLTARSTHCRVRKAHNPRGWLRSAPFLFFIFHQNCSDIVPQGAHMK